MLYTALWWTRVEPCICYIQSPVVFTLNYHYYAHLPSTFQQNHANILKFRCKPIWTMFETFFALGYWKWPVVEFLTNICLNFVNNIHLVFRYSEFSNARPAQYTTDAEKWILVVLKNSPFKRKPPDWVARWCHAQVSQGELHGAGRRQRGMTGYVGRGRSQASTSHWSTSALLWRGTNFSALHISLLSILSTLCLCKR